MKACTLIYTLALVSGFIFLNTTTDNIVAARQIVASLIILGFGIFVTIGHRLIAEQLVDTIESRKK